MGCDKVGKFPLCDGPPAARTVNYTIWNAVLCVYSRGLEFTLAVSTAELALCFKCNI